MNRFSQPIQPFVVNPMSIEDLSRIPIAKAMAKASGIRAANSLALDYEVDAKDLDKVASMVKPIEDGKNTMVSRIMEEGVNSSTITDFLSLKKGYDKVADNIQLAQQNKKKIDKWNDDLLRVHGANTNYINVIKEKEYRGGWEGTFVTDDEGNVKAQTFDKTLGPTYSNIPETYIEALKGITPTMIGEIQSGKVSLINRKDPATNKMYTIMQTTGDITTTSNWNKVIARMNALNAEYADETTERGKFASYMNYDEEYVSTIGERIAASYRVDNKDKDADHYQLVGETFPTKNNPPENEGEVVQVTNLPKVPIGQSVGKAMTTFEKGADTRFKQSMAVIGAGLGVAKDAFDVAFFTKLGMPTRAQKNVLELAESNQKYDNTSVESKAVRDASYLEGAISSDLFALQAGNAMEVGKKLNFPPINGLALTSTLEALGANSGQYPLYDKDNNLIPGNVKPHAKESSKILKRYIGATPTRSVKDVDIVSSQANNIWDVRHPDWNEKAHVEDVKGRIAPGSQEVPILNINNKTKVNGDEASTVYAAFDHYGNTDQEIKDGYKLEYKGVASPDPSLNRVRTGEYSTEVVKNTAYGEVFQLIPLKEDGSPDTKQAPTYYIVGVSKNVSNDPNYQRMASKVEDLGNIEYGQIKEGSFTGGRLKGQKVEIEAVQYDTPAFKEREDGKFDKVWAKPGDLVIYSENDAYPIIYTMDMFKDIEISNRDLDVKSALYKAKVTENMNQLLH